MFVVIIKNLNIVTRNSSCYRAGKSWIDLPEVGLVEQVAADGPTSFSLPPRVVNQHIREVPVDPADSVRIASFTNQ